MKKLLKALRFGGLRSAKIDFDDIIVACAAIFVAYVAYSYFPSSSFFNAPKKEMLDECASYIGKPVAKEFAKTGANLYKYQNRSPTMQAITNDDLIVVGCIIGLAFDKTNEAGEWRALFYKAFEQGGWRYIEHYGGGTEIYSKGAFEARLFPLETREDRGIVVTVAISKKDN
ncbi:MAG: hypothetical protein LBO72_05420 [Helicobacteraceae bacterium]|jgi:hypothetical protein|nr:hypothetical protein [Helicobacteraceae bacterium]